MPKPPPTSPTTTRILSAPMPSTPASVSRIPVGIWVLMRTVRRPSASPAVARMVRGSIGEAASRWLTMEIRATCAAAAKALSLAAGSPCRNSAETLSPAEGSRSGAPVAAAFATSVTEGNSSKSIMMASVASRACSRDCATTAAIGSPT